jgi:hypothetical protein
MEQWPDVSRVSDSKTVVRVIKRTATTFDPPWADKPLPDHAFRLSDEDESEGLKRNLQPLLSVWDCDGVCLATAKSLRRTTPGEVFVGYILRVADVHRIPAPPPPFAPASVHNDPISSNHGESHCGIQGLFTPKGAPKKHVKAVRVQLLDLCEKHPDESS